MNNCPGSAETRVTDVLPAARPGEVLFARYAYPPNELGYCGLGDGSEWLEAASRGVAGSSAGAPAGADQSLAERARSFDGAWPYLTFLAEVAGIADPLDPLVTEAYWVGNRLLDIVDPADFADRARQWFGSQLGADWSCLTGGSPSALPHHSFHVLAIYPWMGLLRRSGSPQALEVLDRCRIRWGRVIGVHGDVAEVRSRSLVWDGAALTLGPPRAESVRWAADGRSLLPEVHDGQWVSLHWGWVCDVLTGTQLAALRRCTARQLAVTNRAGGSSSIASVPTMMMT